MYSSLLSLTSALEGGVWSTPRPGHFTPGKDPVPIVQEAGWASGPVWTGEENLAPTGIRSPDRPAHRLSLYRLRYPAHLLVFIKQVNHDVRSREREISFTVPEIALLTTGYYEREIK